MTTVELISLIVGAGWTAAAMMALALGGAAGGLQPRVTVWFAAFCLLRGLIVASPAVADVPPGTLRLALVIGSAMLLWESARRQRAETTGRKASAAWHLLPLESVALLYAVDLGVTQGVRPAWALPVELAAEFTPALLGLIALRWWWPTLRSLLPWRTAGVAATLACCLPSPMEWSQPIELGLAWLAAAGLGSAALADPLVRARTPLAFLAGFGAAVMTIPVGASWARARASAAIETELAVAAESAARQLHTPAASPSGSAGAESRAAGLQLFRKMDDLRATHPVLRPTGVWRQTEGRLQRLGDDGEFVEWRQATPAEVLGFARSAAFVHTEKSSGIGERVMVFAPLRATRFETPAFWLALEYPNLLRDSRIAAAQRSAVSGLALTALAAAGVFVVFVRQAREAEQRSRFEQARAADRAKSEFLAFLSHELRTPLQVIHGRAEQLARTEDSIVQQRATAAIAAQARLMLRLVNDLLDLATLEAGRLPLQREPHSLRRLVATAADLVADAAASKGLSCRTTVDPTLPDWFSTDEVRLLQILGNLLSNAVKYTRTGGVELVVEPAGTGSVRFRVRDTGIGLPSNQSAQLFTLFSRLDSGATLTRDGAGVGLALVRRLVHLMGGTVAAANRADGHGAEFCVELPLEPAPPANGVPAPAINVPATGGKRVLVVEDHPAVGELLADHLRSLGHQPVVAADAAAALATGTGGHFDAVIVDVNLPDGDGLALAATLATRAAPEPRPRLIACSAEALPSMRARALASGMDAFLTKPVSLVDLRDALAGSAVDHPRDFFRALRESPAATAARAQAETSLDSTRAAIARAVSCTDWSEVAQRAHYLRNSAHVLGDEALVAAAEQLEVAARAGDAAAIRQAASRV